MRKKTNQTLASQLKSYPEAGEWERITRRYAPAMGSPYENQVGVFP